MEQAGQPSGDRPPRRELQGPRPTPLKVRKSSHKIRKPPVAPQAASAAHQPPPPSNPPPPRPPVIIYAVSPKVIHTSPSGFMNLVQRLTGPDPGPFATSATSAFSGAAAGPSSMLSPAARYASIEKTKIPLQGNFINSAASNNFMEGINTSGYEYLLDTRPGGFTHGHSVLSPGPAGLIRPVPPAFFSPLSDPISPLISMYHQHQQDHLNTLQQLQHLGGGGGEGGGWSGGYNILPSPSAPPSFLSPNPMLSPASIEFLTRLFDQ